MGDAVVSLLDSPMFAGRRKILVGFSQGGYMSYRMVLEHPHVFDAAILMSPSFKGEESTDLTGFDSPTRFLLLYGSRDRTIPPADQQTARRVLEATGRLEYREYPGMGQPSSTRRSATSAPSSVSSRFRPPRHPTIRHTRHAPVTARNRCRRHASPQCPNCGEALRLRRAGTGTHVLRLHRFPELRVLQAVQVIST